MDALTLATTFATLIGLVGQFKSERQSTSSDEFKDFLLWLNESNHAELKDFLTDNLQATDGIKTILANDKDELLQKLQAINDVVSQVASSMEGFNQVASALGGAQELSDQAKSVVQQLIESEGSKFVRHQLLSGTTYSVMDGDRRDIICEEPRFIEDDLAILVRLSLLNIDYTKKGSALFRLTRAAVNLAENWTE